ncbi:MAG: hypothetical protein IIA83_00605 [Thaumarchaeota archaeon]|nr:hypothetical protein [Nitrososphaerota archaeon]
MEYRPRDEFFFDETIHVKVGLKGKNIVYFKQEIQNTERLNHKIYGKFSVRQTPPKFLKSNIKIHILTDLQFIQWTSENPHLRRPVFSNFSKSSIVDPQEYLYSSKDALTEGSFEISVDNIPSIFFTIDNSHSAFRSKDVELKVWEKWDEKIPSIDLITKRKKFVSAKEELDKAKKNSIQHPEDVFNHLRTAIDLSIQGQFGFKKIFPISQFITDAEKYNFPFPSPILIRTILSEGNSRLHEGKIATEFDAKNSIQIVQNFMDELAKIKVSQEQIEDFKNKSKSAM